MRRPVFTLILLASLTFLAGLGRQAITEADEAFYAEASREMVASGDWLTPRFNYENRWEKPVLYYWLTSASYLAIGPSEGAARLGAALSGIALALLTYFVALERRLGERCAWLAGAIVASCFGYFAEARMALPDLPLALFITATIWTLLRAADPEASQTATEASMDNASGGLRWWVLAGLAAGLGFLTKGPVALIIPAIVVVPIWWLERHRLTVRVSGAATAIIVAAIVGLPWYVAMWRVHGLEYLRVFFVENNVQRFATQEYNSARPLWFYVPILLGGLLPWSAYLIVFAAPRARKSPDATHSSRDTMWRLLLWLFMPLLFYTASIGKQPRYILPVLPPLAILLAVGMTRCISAPSDRTAARILSIATWTTGALFLVAAALLVRAQPVFINTYPTLTWASAGAVLIAALTLGGIAMRRAWPTLPIALPCCAVVFLFAVEFGAMVGRRPEAVEQMATLVQSNRQGNERVAEYHAFDRNLVFYLRFKQEQLFDLTQATAFLQSNDRVLLVASREDVAMLQQSRLMPLRVLGQVRYANTASLRLRDVIDPDPERVIETVLLVSNR